MLLENTVSCNIDCLGCDRENAASRRSQRQMPLDQITRMADLVHDLGLQQLFYLNLGEPFLSRTLAGTGRPAGEESKLPIVISTNGIILNTDAKREAALHASHIFFSIAGVDDDMRRSTRSVGASRRPTRT